MQPISEKSMKSFYDIFPVPDYLSFAPVGIDISPKAVRAMRLKRSKHGFVPEVYKNVELGKVCDMLESEQDALRCDELQQALQQIKKELQVEFAYISLPELKTYIFQTTLPREAAGTIDDALVLKIQENVPLPPSEIIYDYTVTRHTLHTNEIHVVVTVLPKNVVAAYTRLCEEVGIVPLAFESESQSIARSIILPDDDTSYLLINMGHTGANLAIVEHGVVHYTSSFPYDGASLPKSTDGPEAQALKKKINQLLVYWFTNAHDANLGEKVAAAFVTGPLAADPAVISFLKSNVHIDVRLAQVWKNCFDINEHVPPISRTASLEYATSVGLALLEH